MTVNGRPATLGDRADPERDVVTIDGKTVELGGQRVYLILNKPRGYVTTLSDQQGRLDVRSLVEDCGVRVWPVGRLDMYSEGLLLLTNDGELTQRLTHPSYGVEKEYLVWVTGDAAAALPRLRSPMMLEGQLCCPRRVELRPARGTAGASVLSVTLNQGKNRQIRRMCQAAGLEVVRLRRVREDSICLGNLKPGSWRYLTEEEILRLKQG